MTVCSAETWWPLAPSSITWAARHRLPSGSRIFPGANLEVADLSALVLISLAVVATAVAYWKDPGLPMLGAKSGLSMVWFILPRLIPALILAGMLQVLIPQETVARYFGQQSGIGAILMASAAGVLTPGGPMVSVPLLVVLANMSRIRALRQRLAWRRHPASAPRHSAALWYGRMTQALSKRGWRKSPEQTAVEFVGEIPDQHVRRSLGRFTHHYERARFAESREDAELLLSMVQGSLVQFPYDWLKAEEHNSNWLYQVDQVAPLQI
jgi:hypothetical protein